jgi:hypothetical protein
MHSKILNLLPLVFLLAACDEVQRLMLASPAEQGGEIIRQNLISPSSYGNPP